MTPRYTPPPREDIRGVRDVARALINNPPDFPGWELGTIDSDGRGAITFQLVDDDHAVARFTLTISDVELDESRCRPEPPERERGDDQ